MKLLDSYKPSRMVTTVGGYAIHEARELETGLLLTDCDRVLDAVGSSHDIGPTCLACIRWQHDAGDHAGRYVARCTTCRKER